MSRPPAVSCEGAPRDLGLDQGRFARHAIADALRGAPASGFWQRLRPDPTAPEERVGRDLRRYFPHMAERTAGMARGAGTGEPQLWGLLRAAVAAPGGAVLAAVGEAPAVVQSVHGKARDWLVRRSAPGEDCRSVELVLPGVVPAVAGANEHGLVVAASWVPDAQEGHTEPCRAPGLLLVQDCLQRFTGVEGALGWCQRRPAGGETTIVLADGTGSLVGVHIAPQERTVFEPADGLLVAPFADDRADALRKRMAASTSQSREALGAALTAEGEPTALRLHLEGGRAALGVQTDSDAGPAWLDA